MVEPDFKDSFLDFGQAQIGTGKAFAIETEAVKEAGIDVARALPVGKEFVTLRDPQTGANRTFLIESVEHISLDPLLQTLPKVGAVAPKQVPGQQMAPGARRPLSSRAEFIAALPKPVPASAVARGMTGLQGAPARIQLAQSARTSPVTPRPSVRMRGQPIVWFGFDEWCSLFSTDAMTASVPGFLFSFTQRCSLLLALLDVPKRTRTAIHLSGIVVSRLNRAAEANLPAALLRWEAKSGSAQPSRCHSSVTIRSARPTAFSRRKSPAWCSPSWPSIRSCQPNGVSAQQPSHPRHQVCVRCLDHR